MLKHKKYLLLYPFTYFCIKGKKLLLYNTLSGEKYLNEKCDKNILSIVEKLSSLNNLGVVEINSKLDSNELLFLEQFKEKMFGDIIFLDSKRVKPVQIPNQIHFSNNKFPDKFKFPDKYKGFAHISELHFFLRSSYKYVHENKLLYKQFLTNNNFHDCSLDLDYNKFRELLNRLINYRLSIVTLYCDDIFEYEDCRKLFDLLNGLTIKVELVFSYNYYENVNNQISKYLLSSNIDIIVHHYDNILELKKEVCNSVKLNCFFVESEDQYQYIENKLIGLGINNYHINGVYNGTNDAFFESNIFINLEDIFEDKISFHNIHINKEMNKNDFGKLIIVSNGDVYANINNYKLGNIYNNTLEEVLEDEIKLGTSWGNTRKNVCPCNECIYNCICPPISNYEYVIGKYNLCHVC